MPPEIRELELDESQYLRLVATQAAVAPAMAASLRIVVTESVTLPAGVERLPGVPTVFEGDLDATRSSLREFNGRVEGTADFRDVATLERFGRVAEFGNLRAQGSGIKEFDSVVWGDADFYKSKLETVSSRAYIGGELLSVGNTPLREFHGRVKGRADLSSAPDLKLVGEEAAFGADVDLRWSGVERFLGKAEGHANFNGVESLKVLGSEHRLGSIDARGTGLERMANAPSGFYDRRLLALADREDMSVVGF